MEILKSTGLVLRKTIYGENSLILSLLSAEYGLMSFLSKGALRSKKTPPIPDLFRVIEVVYPAKRRGELYTLREASLITDYRGIAGNYQIFNQFQWVASFLERNLSPDLPLPLTYEKLTQALELGTSVKRSTAEGLSLITGVLLSYLCEDGLIDEMVLTEGKPALSLFIEALEGSHPLPRLTATNWQIVLEWLQSVMNNHHLKLPNPGLTFFHKSL